MAIYGYTKNYKLIKPKYDTDTWHDYEYDNLDTIDAVLSAIYASGNWKGFWATNTAYVAGDVVIDRDTDTMYKVMVEHTTSEATFAAEQTAHPDYYELWSPNNLAESWAVKTDDKVSNTDYSAKAYAISSGLIAEGSAKEWATTASGHATAASTSAEQASTSANSSASFASSASTSATNAATSAELSQSWAVSDTLVNGTDYSAKHYANQANTEASNAAQSATNAANSATASADSATSASASAQAAQDALNDVHGLIATPIGTIFQSVYVDESQDIARQLNGQLISSTKFTGFRSWLNTVQTAIPNLFTTETNWQAEKTNSKLGQCGKFVIDDTAGTIRLPCVVNAQGLADLALIGGIKSESLPNITASWEMFNASGSTRAGLMYKGTGAVDTDDNGPIEGGSAATMTVSYNGYHNQTFDASRSSSTYQDNAPVQQEAVQYPYYIQVATGVEETLPAIREYEINTPFFFGQSMYSDVAPDNASWLASNGQYNAKTVYPDYYDWLVEQMNAGVSGFVASTDTYTDYDYVINTADQTFRLPLLNGERVLVKKYVNGTDWYNLYSDGWLEQGYSFDGSVASLTFLKQFKDTNYSIAGSPVVYSSQGVQSVSVTSKTATGISWAGSNYSSTSWIFCGYAEIPTRSDFTEVAGLYYYVGDTVQDASLINAGAVLGQLSDKISRTAASDREMIVGWGMPDYSAVITPTELKDSIKTYTVPFDSMICGQIYNGTLYCNEQRIGSCSSTQVSVPLTFFANKNDVVRLEGSSYGSIRVFPLKGVN